MKKLFFMIGFMALLQSCSTIQDVYFERLQPADVSFPEQIRSVGVVNNMPPVHQDYKHVDYTSASLEGDGDVAAEALAQEVVSVDYFDQVVLYDKRIRESVQPLEQPIPKKTVDELIRTLDVDMLLSMEYEIKGDTEMEITMKALFGLAKEKATVAYELNGDTLVFDGATYTRVK